MRVCVVIPARQWSVGCPGKNRDGFENALIAAHQVATAGIVLTTDDPLLWLKDGVTVIKRPASLEDGPTEAVIAHAVQDVQADAVLVLQPSSPTLNRAEYCRAAIRRLAEDHEATSVISVVPWVGEPPQKAVYVERGRLIGIASARRQECPPAYRRDGTFYLTRLTYAKGGDLYGPRPVPLLVTPRDSMTVD